MLGGEDRGEPYGVWEMLKSARCKQRRQQSQLERVVGWRCSVSLTGGWLYGGGEGMGQLRAEAAWWAEG